MAGCGAILRSLMNTTLSPLSTTLHSKYRLTMFSKNLRQLAFLLLPFLAILSSCGNKGEKIPDVSGINVDLHSQRLDLDLYAIDTTHIGAGLQQLEQQYPDFLDFYLDTVMLFDIHHDFSDTAKNMREVMHEYLTFKDYVNLEDTIKKYYPDTKDIDLELTQAFRYMKYYFPTYKEPKVIYLDDILHNRPAFFIDTSIACVCLDMFLGPQFPFYKSVGIPDYMAPHLRKNYIPVSLFTSFYENINPFMPDDRPLLDLMIQRGKLKYFLHKILPATPDSVLFGFTGNQINWCTKNEAQVYNFFIQQNLLYSKEEKAIMTYVYDGPFAKGIGSPTDEGKPTPGNIGTWLGYRIVCAYIAQHPKTSLTDLLNMKIEPALFLDAAYYKPR